MLCATDGLHMHGLSLANGGKGWKRIGKFLDIGSIEGVWFEDERLCGQQSYDKINNMSSFIS
jgi:hypothetical protein